MRMVWGSVQRRMPLIHPSEIESLRPKMNIPKCWRKEDIVVKIQRLFCKQMLANSSLTEQYHPKHRKIFFEPLPKVHSSPDSAEKGHLLSEDILRDFSLLQSQIGGLSRTFASRMQFHEEEVFQAAKREIQVVQKQCAEVIHKYSQQIKERNLNQELWDLKYQVKYYQNRAAEIYIENSKLRKEIGSLQIEIQDMKLGLKCEQQALRNVSKKYLREKILRNKTEVEGHNPMGRLEESILRHSKNYTSEMKPARPSYQPRQLLLRKTGKEESTDRQTTSLISSV